MTKLRCRILGHRWYRIAAYDRLCVRCLKRTDAASMYLQHDKHLPSHSCQKTPKPSTHKSPEERDGPES